MGRITQDGLKRARMTEGIKHRIRDEESYSIFIELASETIAWRVVKTTATSSPRWFRVANSHLRPKESGVRL